MKTANGILSGAITLVEAGWTQGEFHHQEHGWHGESLPDLPQDRFCAVGALQAAAGGEVRYSNTLAPTNWYDRWQYNRVRHHVARHVRERLEYSPDNDESTIIKYNDDHATSAEDVATLLQEVRDCRRKH